jgi:hypothetical protein
LNIVSAFGADEETFVAKCHVNRCNRAFKEVDEGADMEVGLLVVEVKLATVGTLRWQVIGLDLSFEAFGQVVFEFELGVKAVCGGPCLG